MESVDTISTKYFTDILAERRSNSDVLWASRAWNGVRAYNPPHKYSPEEIKSVVLNSYHLKQTLIQISKLNRTPLSVLYNLVGKILDEIGYKREVSILRWLGLFVTKILKKLCSSVYVNEAKFLKIKSQMGANPLLFLPTHKSYCDFILMSYICFNYNVDIPRIAAGMDFQSMAVLGNILRDACAFFMRRSFSQDKIYSAVFSQYVQTLVTDGDAAIEFFIEGTRSRTAKPLTPKYGFLSMVLKPFFIGLVPNVTVIPVNISYDRVLEEVLFAYELLGVPKPKESTKGFVKALSILNENFGNMYVHFGDPFTVKEFFGNKLDRSVHGFGSVEMQEISASEMKHVVHLAHQVVRKQRELTILSCFNLIAAIVNNNFINQLEPIFLHQLVLEVEWLFSILKVLVPKTSLLALNDISENFVLHHLELHKSLVHLTNKKQIHIHRIHSQMTAVDSSKLKGHNLSNCTMDFSIPLIMLQYYVNPCANFLIGLCFIALIVHPLTQDCSFSIDQLFDKFKFLCLIFSNEFGFHLDFLQTDFDEALKHSQTLKVVAVGENNQIKRGDNEKLHSFCINFLSSYIPGYITLSEFLLKSVGKLLEEKEVLRGSQELIETKLSNGIIQHPSNLSLDLLMNALQAFTSLKAVSKVKGEKKIKYSIDQHEMEKLHSNLKLYDFFKKSSSNKSQQFSLFIKNNL